MVQKKINRRGCRRPKIFRQCTLDGLYRLLSFLDEKNCSITGLEREVFGSHVQARKYIRLAGGLRLVRAAYSSRTPDGPDFVVYSLTRDAGKAWLSRLQDFDEEKLPGGQLIQFFFSKTPARAYSGTGRRWSKIS
jgi:hypothetical protein